MALHGIDILDNIVEDDVEDELHQLIEGEISELKNQIPVFC